MSMEVGAVDVVTKGISAPAADVDRAPLGPVAVVLTMATNDNAGMRNARDSLLKHGRLDVRVLGLGEKWGWWQHRMRTYRDEAAKVAESAPDMLVVCMDAYDALSLRNCDSLPEVFASFGKPMVLSVESCCYANCMPLTEWWQTDGHPYVIDGVVPKDRYVNGGLLMGHAAFVRDLYDWMLRAGAKDDQVGLARWALAHRDRWAPDVRGKIFKNLPHKAPLSKADLQGQGCYFAHFPGMHGTGLEEYERAVLAVLNRPSGMPRGWSGPVIILAICILVLCLLALLALLWSITPARLKPAPLLRLETVVTKAVSLLRPVSF
jgi:hypothetical protein